MQRYERYKDSGIDWLGEIPSHWDVKRLKSCFSENTQYNNGLTEIKALQFRFGEIVEKKKFDLDENLIKTLEKYTVVIPDDIMINGLNLNYDFITQRVAIVKEAGIITSAYISLRPKNHIVSLYYLYYLKSIDNMKLFNGMGVGIRLTLSYKELKNYYLAVPSIEEQSAIARFLDEKCEQIDRAVAQKERVIELLNERRQIVIQRAVTRGLNPDTPLRDSGIDWIGQIPVHWQVTRLKSMFSFGKGLNITKENLQDEGIPVVNYGQVHSKLNTGTGITSSIIKYVSSDYLQTSKRALVKCNDFIFADTSEDLFGAGNCVFVDVEDLIFAGYHTIILKSKMIDGSNKYLAYLFKTNCWRSQIRSLVTGIKVYSITNSILSKATIILPPNAEQEEIAAYLDTVNQKIDRAVALKREEIEKLKEYKQTLINSAVTGKIKIA